MEVHHHPHVEKKKFKAYFLEFIMIFLAVTLGFFAEGLREHMGDSSKGREYISAMFDEIKYDTSQYRNSLAKVKLLSPMLDSCYINVKKASKFNYILLAKWNTPVNEMGLGYRPTLPTIEQLKSSGNLRLLHSQELVQKIMEYETFIRGDYESHYENINRASKQVYSLEDRFCDYADFNAKLDSNMRHIDTQLSPEGSQFYDMPIVVKDNERLNELANSFVNFKANNYGYATSLNNAIKLAIELLDVIGNTYHLKSNQ